MNESASTSVTNLRAHVSRVVLLVSLVVMGLDSPAWGKVLFLVHADGSTAKADFALGATAASPVWPDVYKVAGTVAGGRWGRALDLTSGTSHCAYDATRNLDPRRGTVDLWFLVETHKEGMYHPLVGWYRPPQQPGKKKRQSAFEVYLLNSALTLGLYTPEYKGHIKAATLKVGQWQHLEVNWDCTAGPGKSVYNVFLDGKRVIGVENAGALKGGAGGRLHVGVWDYGFGNVIQGRIDEIRVTDQVEHSAAFQPSDRPYSIPGTVQYARDTHRTVDHRLKQLVSDIKSLKEFSGTDGGGVAAKVIRSSQAAVEKVTRALTAMSPTLKSKDADGKQLTRAVDVVAEQVNLARMAIHRVSAAAAAIAAREDRRSLLFKDLNDVSAGDAIVLNGRQLFIDDHVIEKIRGARKVLNRPVKHPRNPLIVAEKPWEKTLLNRGSVIYDEQAKLFKMWYSVYTTDLKEQLLCYATSRDGIKWDKPLINEAGQSNVIPDFRAANPPSVFKDVHEPDPARRYKMLYGAGQPRKYTTNAAYSPDGLSWTPESSNPVIPHSDTLNSCFWDPARRRYVAHVRFGPPNTRWVSLTESPDFVHWSPKVTVLKPSSIDEPFETKHYGMRVLPYEGTLLGFLSAYHGETIRPIPADEMWRDRTNVQLAFSRDGLTWQRVGKTGAISDSREKEGKRDWKPIAEGATFLPYGTSRKADWDWGQVYPFDPPLIVGDQIWFYYQGLKGRHWFKQHKDPLESGFGLATLRLDGFVSVDAPQAGTLQTRRFIAIGDTLVINAKADGGEIRVEAIDALGRVISGFSKEDCTPIRGDSVRHVVSWKGGPNCHQLQARPIKLRFHLKTASLFSFEFQIRRNHFVPLSFRQ